MISLENAERLRLAGLRWDPESGDRFTLLEGELRGDVFTVADMVVEARHYPTGTLLAFNGTTEWALDSVQLERALWLPREDQLRGRLGRAFRSLCQGPTGDHEVWIAVPGRDEQGFVERDAANAYAQALLALIEATR